MTTQSEQFDKAMEQFKGQSFPCADCGREGIYDNIDLTFLIVIIWQWTWAENGRYISSVQASFKCKNSKECEERQRHS